MFTDTIYYILYTTTLSTSQTPPRRPLRSDSRAYRSGASPDAHRRAEHIYTSYLRADIYIYNARVHTCACPRLQLRLDDLARTGAAAELHQLAEARAHDDGMLFRRGGCGGVAPTAQCGVRAAQSCQLRGVGRASYSIAKLLAASRMSGAAGGAVYMLGAAGGAARRAMRWRCVRRGAQRDGWSLKYVV